MSSPETSTTPTTSTPVGERVSPDEAKRTKRSRRIAVLGAIFLMATSAIGPGFITQTAAFTVELGASFAFAVLASVIIDFAVQLNVWRMVISSGKRAGELANSAIPYSGYVIAVLVILGGLAFNIGNIAGGGLGLNAIFGISPKLGGLVTAVLAIVLFMVRRAGRVVDVTVIILGIAMVVLTVIVAFATHPPVGDALRQTVVPDSLNFAVITTIVGGTVGGFITYSGAHRYLDSGNSGPEHASTVTKAAANGIAVTGIMRYVLFLAILGVAVSGATIDLSSHAANPAGQAFGIALGSVGLRIFGVVFWGAAISSVIGNAYTSVSFLSTFHSAFRRSRPLQFGTVVFIIVSLAIYLSIGTPPAQLLIFAGGLNGLILPIGLSVLMFIGWARPKLLKVSSYPKWLLISGSLVTLLMWYTAIVSIGPIFSLIGL